MFDIITAESTEPVGLDEIKAHLNLTTSDFDIFVSGVVQAAVELVQKEINGPIMTTEFNYYPDRLCFPVSIPKGNIQEVSAVQYRTADGVWNDLDTDLWDYSSIGGRGVVFIKPERGVSFGSLYSFQPFRITFTAGFGDNPEDVPGPIIHAIKIICGHLFENRETAMSNMPMPATMLLNHYRCWTAEMF